MNYIRHLNSFFNQIKRDDRLNAMHVSLYLALFQYWNFNRFQNPFAVYRDNIMQLSKIGSKNTYHKCVKELHQFNYIVYHPAPSKYLPVKISIVRLDIKDQQADIKQLELFSGSQVPDLTGASLKNETPHVPDLGQHIKHSNILKNSVSDTPTINQMKMGEGKEKQTSTHVPLMRHIPTIQQVEQYFKEQFQSSQEAHKFFYYNQSKNWMLTEKIPVYDWKALAQKWMLNERQINPNELGAAFNRDIQYLYERYLQGEKINKLLLPEYADHLHLKVTEVIMQQAWQRRINQLSGSNEGTEIKLWHAYMKGEVNNELLKNDQPNLISLAKRVALLKHFQKSKAKGQTSINHSNNNSENEH